jgi:hypothetical protein
MWNEDIKNQTKTKLNFLPPEPEDGVNISGTKNGALK